MNLGINKLKFRFPENTFSVFAKRLDEYTNSLKSLCKKAGTQNDKFKNAFSRLYSSIQIGQDLSAVIDSPIMVRALAISLQSNLKNEIALSRSVINQINRVRPKPSSLLIENMYQHYLSKFDQLVDPDAVADWLKTSLELKGRLKEFHKHLLRGDGPKWLAHQCIDHDREFTNQLQFFDLQNYQSGRFLTIAKNIYYVEQLRHIPVNKPHDLLREIQNKATFESRYDEHYLLGHKILQILIKRAPNNDIHDSWLNVVLAIAGDPRVPKSHVKYQKWWSQIDASLNIKVNGWLSRLDLRLFLEALESYSYMPGNSDLKRMFPARKDFLEGLLNKKLITGTRLFLTYPFSNYLTRNYNPEHLPNYSKVSTGNISVIHIQLGETQMIEGSHNCKLWIYKSFDPSSVVYDYSINAFTYSSLTTGLNWNMKDQEGSQLLIDAIVHHPNLGWQNKAIKALNSTGVDIKAKDVLSEDDYERYIRRYGVG